MDFIFAAAIVLAIGVALIGFYQSDQIMRILRERYPDEWRKLGYPCSYFKSREAVRDHWWERDKIVMKLPLWWVKIDWIEKDEEAKRLRKRIACTAALVNAIALCGIISWWVGIFSAA